MRKSEFKDCRDQSLFRGIAASAITVQPFLSMIAIFFLVFFLSFVTLLGLGPILFLALFAVSFVIGCLGHVSGVARFRLYEVLAARDGDDVSFDPTEIPRVFLATVVAIFWTFELTYYLLEVAMVDSAVIHFLGIQVLIAPATLLILAWAVKTPSKYGATFRILMLGSGLFLLVLATAPADDMAGEAGAHPPPEIEADRLSPARGP